jgi:microcystin-dependent protein
LLSIAQNQALFSILGTSFGGNGTSTFGLPDMRGRVPVGTGKSYALGHIGGEENHLLTAGEVPGHTHPVQGLAAIASQPAFASGLLATTPSAAYAAPSANMQPLPGPVQSVGGKAHPNLQPYQVITMCIALAGIFPSRN